MLSICRKLVFFSILFVASGCLAGKTAVRDDIQYTVRVRGDDALTMSLANTLERNWPGYRFVPIDLSVAGSIMVFLKGNLEYERIETKEYAKFEVEFILKGRVVKHIIEKCLINDIGSCKDRILSSLNSIRK